LCKNHAQGDDLAQETFLRAYQKYDQLKDGQAQKAWLFQIAYRIFLDYIRKETRRKNIDGQKPDAQQNYQENSPGVKLDVARAMDTLPPAQRAALLLSLSYQMSHSEIACALGQPLGTVKSNIARGKKQLRAFLRLFLKPMKGHNEMMSDNSEDKIFKDLLSDYARPVPDGGFSAAVLTRCARRKDNRVLKTVTIGSAALVGGLIAAAQLPALLQLTSKFSVPEIPTSKLATIDVNTLASTIFASPFMLATALLVILWFCATVLSGDAI